MKATIIIASALALIGAPALADEVQWTCRPLSEVEALAKEHGGGAFVRLTDAQWEFARGVYSAMQDTPEAIPPGDHAVMSTLPDGAALLAFVDDGQSCALVKVFKTAVDMFISVGEGEITHAGESP